MKDIHAEKFIRNKLLQSCSVKLKVAGRCDRKETEKEEKTEAAGRSQTEEKRKPEVSGTA